MITFGVDIGKFRHQAIAVDACGQALAPSFAFENSEEGFQLFLQKVAFYQKQDTICVSMEATGHYWLNLYCALLDLGIELHVFNPILTDAMRRMSVRKTKTDTVDCGYIVDVIRMGRYSDVAVQTEDVQNLRQLCRYRCSLVDEAAKHKNHVIVVLDHLFPEYHKLFSNIFGKTSLDLLSKYPSPDAILKLGTKRLADFLAKHSRGRFGEEKALEVRNACKHTVGVNRANAALCFELHQTVELIQFVEDQIDEIEKRIEQIYSQCECYLDTIIGVGVTSAAVIYSEIGNIENFDSPKKLAAFAGIDPSIKQSGNFTSTHNKMSKRGSPYLRRALWNAATVAAQKDPVMSAFFQKKRDEGKDYMTAIGAVTHKLCNIVFAVLRDKKPYVPRA